MGRSTLLDVGAVPRGAAEILALHFAIADFRGGPAWIGKHGVTKSLQPLNPSSIAQEHDARPRDQVQGNQATGGWRGQ